MDVSSLYVPVRTYVHLLSGWMCALCFMYAYVLFVHYMVCSLLLSICMYTACFLYVRVDCMYCMQYVLYSINVCALGICAVVPCVLSVCICYRYVFDLGIYLIRL